ncbi:MAG: amino acid ABC transporter permease [Sphingomonadales bacterium]
MTRRAAGWIRVNLFSTPFNAALTVLALYVVYVVAAPLFAWAIVDAHFIGEDRTACGSDGACWVFVRARLGQFIYGFYPEAERWRANLALALFVMAAIPAMRRRGRFVLILFLGFPIVAGVLLAGGWFGLEPVPTSLWGGLMLTLVIAVTGIFGSLPLGILLALGRRSDLPVVRALCVAFIELWRGVPLITVLFMASVMLPLFLPEGVSVDKLVRALVGVALFSSAYVAEVVRGGLQAIPRGQYEAARALGLGYWRMMGLVILPQAVRIVIPGLVNTFISLFKDSTLVLIIGLFDVLGIVQAAATDPAWLGFAAEGYVFAGLVFWVFCFTMSRYSRRLEGRGEGERA